MDINNINYIFSTRDVIEIQSRYYYQQKEELGFFTLSETLNEYADFVARHISHLWKLSTPLNTKDEKRIKIIELGPGTGRFTKRLLNILKENNIFVEYTMVDLNPLLRSLAEETEAMFYNCSFEVFTQSFDQEYDFFILNEALDMWAGEHISIDEDGNKYDVFWRLRDLKTGQWLSKNNVQSSLLPSTSWYWEKIYLDQKEHNAVEYGNIESDEYIEVPENLIKFIKQAKIGGIIQDYWVDEIENPLRTGLSREDCKVILQTYAKEPLVASYLERLEYALLPRKNKSTTIIDDTYERLPLNDIKVWFDSPITPFALSDVTYTPNINKLTEKINSDSFLATTWRFEELINTYDIKLTSDNSDRWMKDEILIIENTQLPQRILKDKTERTNMF